MVQGKGFRCLVFGVSSLSFLFSSKLVAELRLLQLCLSFTTAHFRSSDTVFNFV